MLSIFYKQYITISKNKTYNIVLVEKKCISKYINIHIIYIIYLSYINIYVS